MRFTVLTYNLLYNTAATYVEEVLVKHSPDIIFFQEILTDEQSLEQITRLGYRLADFSNSFIRGSRIFGVATFYKPSRVSLANSEIFSLPSSLYQFLTYIVNNKRYPRTVLKNEFIVKENGHKVTTYNIHLTPVATNGLRMKQIYNTFSDLDLSSRDPVLIAGDFNYPYGRRRFESMIADYGLKEATNNVYFTHERRILGLFSIRLKLDYILYKNMEVVSNTKIELKHSDHYPILSVFSF
jgi:endonuclease/exonuclease/phosphatase family metal-dependent hydrolase